MSQVKPCENHTKNGIGTWENQTLWEGMGSSAASLQGHSSLSVFQLWMDPEFRIQVEPVLQIHSLDKVEAGL